MRQTLCEAGRRKGGSVPLGSGQETFRRQDGQLLLSQALVSWVAVRKGGPSGRAVCLGSGIMALLRRDGGAEGESGTTSIGEEANKEERGGFGR